MTAKGRAKTTSQLVSLAEEAGLGARHQTGWTGPEEKLIGLFGRVDPRKLLEAGPAREFHLRESQTVRQ